MLVAVVLLLHYAQRPGQKPKYMQLHKCKAKNVYPINIHKFKRVIRFESINAVNFVKGLI